MASAQKKKIRNKVLKDNYFLSQLEWFLKERILIFFSFYFYYYYGIYIFIFNEYIVSLNSYLAINSLRLKSNINWLYMHSRLMNSIFYLLKYLFYSVGYLLSPNSNLDYAQDREKWNPILTILNKIIALYKKIRHSFCINLATNLHNVYSMASLRLLQVTIETPPLLIWTMYINYWYCNHCPFNNLQSLAILCKLAACLLSSIM